MSLLLATGEQAIVELNSDLFNSTILTTFRIKKSLSWGRFKLQMAATNPCL